jgi:hypothetical protein
MKRLSIGIAALLACAAGIQAQTYNVAWSKVDEGTWGWNAIYSEDTDGQPVIHSLVAFQDPQTAVPGNLMVVWYVQGSSWESFSWTTSSQWEAINWIKSELGIPDSQDERWFPCEEVVNDAVPAELYSKGVLASDPMAAVILAAPNAAALVQQLVAIGYPAADLSADNPDDCSSDDILDGLASEFTRMISNGDHAYLGVEAVNCTMSWGGPPKGPEPTPRPAAPPAPPPWTPRGPGPAPGPTWTPGGWPANPAYKCKSSNVIGGTKCTCRRIQRYGRWESKVVCGVWTKTVWHEMHETEKCENTGQGLQCPAGGPPPAGSACQNTYTY